jgi:hypothetical protein
MLALEENVARANIMIRIRGMQKIASCIGHASEIGLEERLVNLIKRLQMLGFHVHQFSLNPFSSLELCKLVKLASGMTM